MDEIQKVLVKAGRKDLAQKYYLKIAVKDKQKENVKVAGTIDVTLAELNSAIKKLASFSEADMRKALTSVRGEGITGAGMRNWVFVEKIKNKNHYYLSKDGINATYQLKAYDREAEDESSALRTNVYVNWNGKDFSAAF